MQNSTLRFGTFVFGPVVLRMIHHLKKPDLGIQLVKDSVSHFIFRIHFYSFTSFTEFSHFFQSTQFNDTYS